MSRSLSELADSMSGTRLAARIRPEVDWAVPDPGDVLLDAADDEVEGLDDLPFARAVTPFDRAAAVIIEGNPGGVNLVRLSEDAELAGDTWHTSVEEAQEVAVQEFGDNLGPWIAVPDELDHDRGLMAFLRQQDPLPGDTSP